VALGRSTTVAEELARLEKAIADLDHRIAEVRGRAAANAKKADAEWVSAEIQRLYELLSSDPIAAKAAIARHLEDGEIRITPLEGASERGRR
jgi:phage shock protein A